MLISGTVVMFWPVPGGGRIKAQSFVSDQGEVHAFSALVTVACVCFSAFCREELTETWVNGPKFCVSANDLRTRWYGTDEDGGKITPAAGKHFPAQKGSYGTDVLLLDEADVVALIDAGHTTLPRLASSGRGMTALYDWAKMQPGDTSLPAVVRFLPHSLMAGSLPGVYPALLCGNGRRSEKIF